MVQFSKPLLDSSTVPTFIQLPPASSSTRAKTKPLLPSSSPSNSFSSDRSSLKMTRGSRTPLLSIRCQTLRRLAIGQASSGAISLALFLVAFGVMVSDGQPALSVGSIVYALFTTIPVIAGVLGVTAFRSDGGRYFVYKSRADNHFNFVAKATLVGLGQEFFLCFALVGMNAGAAFRALGGIEMVLIAVNVICCMWSRTLKYQFWQDVNSMDKTPAVGVGTPNGTQPDPKALVDINQSV